VNALPAPTLSELLACAVEVEEASSREGLLEEIGALALSAGALPFVHEVLSVLPQGPLRAALRVRLVEKLPTEPADEALREIRAALVELDAPGRWRPCLDFISKAELRARCVALSLELGDEALARTQLPALADQKVAKAQAWIALARFTGPDRAVWGWARATLPAVPEAPEALPLWSALLQGTLHHFGPEEALGLLTDARALPLRARASLHAELRAAMRNAGQSEALITLLGASLALVDEAGAGVLAAELLSELLDDYADEPGLAREPEERLLQLCDSTPLPPDPHSPFPWRVLAARARRTRIWAHRLRERLRAHAIVPPAWCYLLGLLELRTGHPDRARRAARALSQSAGPRLEEPESMLLAGLLSSKVGDEAAAEESLRAALAAMPPRCPIRAPEEPELPIEQLVVRILIEEGSLRLAGELAETLPGPLERAELLVSLAQAALGAGDRPEADRRCAEAISALDEAAEGGRAAATPPLYARIAAICAPGCLLQEEALSLSFARVRALPSFLQVPALLAQRDALCGDEALGARQAELALHLLRAVDAPDMRASALLQWARAAGGPA
jgi:hypothetical protein